jgi:hypothetical protein
VLKIENGVMKAIGPTEELIERKPVDAVVG